MEAVDLLLSGTASFILLIIFAGILLSNSQIIERETTFEKKIETVNKAFLYLMSEGAPTEWVGDPENAFAIGVLEDSNSFIISEEKLNKLIELCNNNASLVYEKLGLWKDSYAEIKLINFSNMQTKFSICYDGPYKNLFIKEGFVIYQNESFIMRLEVKE